MIKTTVPSFEFIVQGTHKIDQYNLTGSFHGRTDIAGFDWIQAARNVRALSRPSPDSTLILRELRDKRAQR